MLYRDITHVSVVGLRGTMYIEKDREARGVSVRTTGPYVAKSAGQSRLLICPEGYEPAAPPQQGTMPLTAEGTQVGSVDVAASVRFGGGSGRGRKARASGPAKGTVRITAPPNTTFELQGCRGLRKGPGGWRFMEGSCRFTTR